VTNDLTGKATTKTPITVTTDPNTHVDLLDKDNHLGVLHYRKLSQLHYLPV
jgi:hypothetical protein